MKDYKVKTSFVLCVLFFLKMGFSSRPMEPAKNMIYLFVHGINPHKEGLNHKENDHQCVYDRGVGGNTFGKKGTLKWIRENVSNSYHHVYVQSMEDPGDYPFNLAKQLGQRDRATQSFDCHGDYPPLIWEFDKSKNSTKKSKSSPKIVLKSSTEKSFSYSNWIEAAQNEWFAHEKIEYQVNVDRHPVTQKRDPKLFQKRGLGVWERGNNASEENEKNPGKTKNVYKSFDAVGFNGNYEVKNWIDKKVSKKQDGNILSEKQDGIDQAKLAALSLETLRKERPDLIPSRAVVFAHSMGGPIAREYIHSDFYQGDIDKVITFDSPQEGAGIASQGLHGTKKENIVGTGATALASLLAYYLITTYLPDVPEAECASIYGNLRALVNNPRAWPKELASEAVKRLLLHLAISNTLEAVAEFVGQVKNPYERNAGALQYLALGSKHLKNINSKTAAGNGHFFPPHRIFHNEGIYAIGAPEDIKIMGGGGVVDFLIPDMFEAQWMTYLNWIKSIDSYSSKISFGQKLGNKNVALFMAQADLNFSAQGTMVVPAFSSKADKVAAFSQPNTDVRRHLTSITSNLDKYLDATLILYELGKVVLGWKRDVTSIKCGIKAVAKLPGQSWLKATLPAVEYLYWGGRAVSLATYVKDLPDIDKIKLAETHDLNHHFTYKEKVEKPRVYKNFDGSKDHKTEYTRVEDFLYERPFVSFRIEDEQKEPNKICIGINFESENSEDKKLCKNGLAPMEEKDLTPIDYYQTRGWQGAMGIKKNSYVSVDGPDADTVANAGEPVVRRVKHYKVPNIIPIKDFPTRFKWTVDDVRPDLLRQFSINFNRKVKYVWDRVPSTGLYTVRKRVNDLPWKTYTKIPAPWNPDGDENVISPISETGNWDVIVEHFYEKGPNELIVDGYNEILVSTVNHVGQKSTQIFSLMFQATAPFLQNVWPQDFTVLSVATPNVEIFANALGYPLTQFNNDKTGINIYQRSVEQNESKGKFFRFDTYPKKPDKGSFKKAFTNSSTPIKKSGDYWLHSKLYTKVAGKDGATYETRIPFAYDNELPSLSIQLKGTSDNLPEKEKYFETSFKDDRNQMRFARSFIKKKNDDIENKKGDIVYEFKPKMSTANQLFMETWDGKNTSGKTLADGQYEYVFEATDMAVPSKSGQALVGTIAEMINQKDIDYDKLDMAWKKLNQKQYHLVTEKVLFHLDNTAPDFQLVSYPSVVNLTTKLGFDFKVSDGMKTEEKSMKVLFTFTRNNEGGALSDRFFKYPIEVPIEKGTIATAPLKTVRPHSENDLVDGQYNVSIDIHDNSGNHKALKDVATINVDKSKPNIKNMFAKQFNYSSTKLPKDGFIKWLVDETDMIPSHRRPSDISCKMHAVNPSGKQVDIDTVINQSSHPQYKYVFDFGFMASPGAWQFVAECKDWAGNKDVESIMVFVDERPPQLRNPEAFSILSGTVSVKGLAPHPFPNGSSKFKSFSVQYIALDDVKTSPFNPSKEQNLKSTGITVSPIYRKPGASNVGHVPVSTLAHLASWNTEAVKNGEYYLILKSETEDDKAIFDSHQVRVRNSKDKTGNNNFSIQLFNVPKDYSPDKPGGMKFGLGIDQFSSTPANIRRAYICGIKKILC